MKTLTRLTATSTLLTVGLALALSGSAVLAEETTANPNVEEAKTVLKAFSMQLKDELKAAIKEGGPLKAIDICKERAPAIATEHGEKTGGEIGRTTLKLRNAELNTPDDWEKNVLNEFAQRMAAGEDIENMTHAEVVETDVGKTFRFMKAIPTGEICLACHGTAITPEVAKALDENYPQDQARGYKQNDLRGAFSLSKPL
jgi:hypothetical protein